MRGKWIRKNAVFGHFLRSAGYQISKQIAIMKLCRLYNFYVHFLSCFSKVSNQGKFGKVALFLGRNRNAKSIQLLKFFSSLKKILP